MQTMPETYFSRRMRESQIAMGDATDSCSRLAHSQLEAAYRVLAAIAEPVPEAPRFQYREPMPIAAASATLTGA